MSKDIFGSLPTSIPKSDSRISRVPFDKQDMGGNHLPKLPKNGQPIVHVRQGS